MEPKNQRSDQPHQPSVGASDDNSAQQRDATAELIRNQISRLFGDPRGAASNSDPQPSKIQVSSDQNQARPLASQPRPTQPETASAPTAKEQSQKTGAIDYKPPRDTLEGGSTAPAAGLAISTPQSSSNPYHRTQQNPATISEDDWQRYQSSWQEYYQKYYERYYVQTLAAERKKQAERQAAQPPTGKTIEPALPTVSSGYNYQADSSQSLSKTEAVSQLRSQIKEKVSTSTSKVRKSRHFMPIIAASCVLVVFLFLQYNRVLFAAVEAYVAPGSANPEDIIVNPAATDVINQDPKLIIPKLNVSVPVVYENTMGKTNQETHKLQMKAMEKGIAWFGVPGANSKPGQNGNTVLSGHSSNDVIDPGEYKFIFARLDKLAKGDTIYLNYEGTRYTYRVSGSKVVKPNDVKSLQVGNDKPVLTLITCTPLGTALNRLLVYADQISPDPSSAESAAKFDESESAAEMPGNSKTILQRLFSRD